MCLCTGDHTVRSRGDSSSTKPAALTVRIQRTPIPATVDSGTAGGVLTGATPSTKGRAEDTAAAAAQAAVEARAARAAGEARAKQAPKLASHEDL